jgi:hypothetical protein
VDWEFFDKVNEQVVKRIANFCFDFKERIRYRI